MCEHRVRARVRECVWIYCRCFVPCASHLSLMSAAAPSFSRTSTTLYRPPEQAICIAVRLCVCQTEVKATSTEGIRIQIQH